MQHLNNTKALTIENLIELSWRSMDDEVGCYAYLQNKNNISKEIKAWTTKKFINTTHETLVDSLTSQNKLCYQNNISVIKKGCFRDRLST